MSDPTRTPLVLVGSAGVVCEGDFCAVPPSDQQIVNEMLDIGTV